MAMVRKVYSGDFGPAIGQINPALVACKVLARLFS